MSEFYCWSVVDLLHQQFFIVQFNLYFQLLYVRPMNRESFVIAQWPVAQRVFDVMTCMAQDVMKSIYTNIMK